MIKLYGFPLSNYYNTIKLSMLEKGIEFEEVANPPSQEAGYLSKSPMGKVPCIETKDGFLAESSAIMDFLEETHPQNPLFPADPYARAKVREMNKVLELYIELAARRHLGTVFFGAPSNEAAVTEVRPLIEQGLHALQGLASFNPHFAGDKLTYADIFGYYTFGLANMLCQATYQWDIVAEVPGLGASLEKVASRATTKSVDTAMQAAMAAFQAQNK
ncbi:MAG: glutathione S-transferase [Gammaproteobacteria bacterium]